MKIDYSTFEYDESLYGEVDFNDGVSKKTISVEIQADDFGNIPEESKKLLESFFDNYSKYKEALLKPAYEYYLKRKAVIGKDDPSYPDIKDMKEINDVITLKTVVIHDPERYCKDSIGLVFDCPWDEEEGMGIRMTGLKVEIIGTNGCRY